MLRGYVNLEAWADGPSWTTLGVILDTSTMLKSKLMKMLGPGQPIFLIYMRARSFHTRVTNHGQIGVSWNGTSMNCHFSFK